MSTVRKLRDLAIVAAGQGAPQGEENYCTNGIPFIKAGNLIELLNGKKERDIQNVSEEVAKQYRLKLYPAGTVLFAKSGMSCMKGYVYVLQSDCYVVSHLACIIPIETTGAYLKYYFEYHRPNSLIKDEAYPSISLSDIGNLDIRLETPVKQAAIVNNLDRINALIKCRKAQLHKIDDLVKSQFIEMFGAVGADEKGWGLIALGECCELNPKKSDDDRLKEGVEVSFVPMPAVTEKGELDNSSIRLYEQVQKGFTYFADNDVLFAKITPCMENGKGAVARGLKNGIGFGSTEFHVLRPKAGVSNPVWLYTIMSFKQFRQDAARKMTGSAGQRRVPSSFLSGYKVSLPPIALQNQFAIFVERTDKSKFRIKQSLEKLEKCYKALLQKYFG